MGTAEGKMYHGKILLDTTQDENVQTDAKLNKITYINTEENAQHTHKKILIPRGSEDI